MNEKQREILTDLITRSTIDGMDHKSMYSYCYDNIIGYFDRLDIEEIEEELENYYGITIEEICEEYL